jgi:hypothetical protein
MQNEERTSGARRCPAFILHSSFFISPFVPVVERRPRERAKLEIQVRFLAGAVKAFSAGPEGRIVLPRECEGPHGTLSRR